MPTTPKADFVQRVLGAKRNAQNAMQGLGRRIAQNVNQGQADLKSGKSSYYGSINPFK